MQQRQLFELRGVLLGPEQRGRREDGASASVTDLYLLRTATVEGLVAHKTH